MIELKKIDYASVSEQYRILDAFFPLIGAVLDRAQDGVVYADSAAQPRQFYVEHHFGFAQVFGTRSYTFEAELEHYLLAKDFTAPKVRLYTPQLPNFLKTSEWDGMRSFRQRFIIDPDGLCKAGATGPALAQGMTLTGINARNIAEIEQAFGVTERFWRDQGDFIARGGAVVTLHEGRPAAICYAAAMANHCVEIDVLTLPEFRQRGAGKLAVVLFVQHCFEQSLQPLWDCFANNAGSVHLCRSVGFAARGPQYPFFTISK